MSPGTSLALVLVMNLLDLVSTLALVAFGVCYEANPVMDLFLGFHPLLFTLVKLALVYSGAWFLHTHQDRWLCRVGCHVSLVVYALVLVQHARVISQSLAA